MSIGAMRSIIYFLALSLFLGSCASRAHLRGPRGAAGTGRAQSTGNLEYIERYKGIAIDQMQRYGIPASIKLAQGLLESGAGNSRLAVQGNNHFGIKCGGSWRGPSMRKDDDARNECFRVYRHVQESFEDHSKFLLARRYADLFRLRPDDYKGWARGLKKAGYATNPRYPDLLIELIERYDLTRFDHPSKAGPKKGRKQQSEQVLQAPAGAREATSAREARVEPADQGNEDSRVLSMQVHEVLPGQTLYAIARLYGCSVQDLKLWNNLSSDNLSVGQLLVVRR